MEIDFQRTVLENYRLVLDTIMTQEESMESIVPDALPDVSRVVCASGNACILVKQGGSGCAKLMGNVRASILYLPDGEQIPRSLAVTVPFNCSYDNPHINEATQLHATVHGVTVDARLLNPRKLLIKAEIRIHLCGYTPQKCEICCGLTEKTDASIQKMLVDQTNYSISAVAEKNFTFSELLRQMSSKPAMEDVLFCQAAPGIIETKHISNKLVCKGTLLLNVLYRNNTELIPTQFELPFSQIIDINGTLEAGEPEASVYVKELECRLQEGELEVSVEAVLQAVLRYRCSVPIVKDIYSTSMPLDVERTPISFCIENESGIKKTGARTFFETGIPAKQVISCMTRLGSMVSQRAEQKMEYQADAKIDILYLSEDDALCFSSCVLPVVFEMEVPAGRDCPCVPVSVESVAVPVTGGFEVRVDAEFSWRMTKEEDVSIVSAARGSQAPVSNETRPSVMIRRAGEGDRIWDIAKACGSTIQDICTVNRLDSDHLIPGTILLIPTKR